MYDCQRFSVAKKKGVEDKKKKEKKNKEGAGVGKQH